MKNFYKNAAKALGTLAVGVSCATLSLSALAASWPSGPVRLVVPFPPGSGTDNAARIVGSEMQKLTQQPVVIVNKPGAGGSIAAEHVKQSAADGHTLLFGTVSVFSANPSLYKKLSYDPVKDFSYVSKAGTSFLVLLAKKDLGVKSVTELAKYARENPGKLSAGYGSSTSQAALAQLAQSGDFEILPVPYKGIPLATADLLGGTIDFTFVDVGSAIPLIQSGRLQALGISLPKRSELAPELPALSEFYPGFDISAWFAIAAPKGTPDATIEQINQVTARAMSASDVKKSLATLGIEPESSTPKESADFVAAQIEHWSALLKKAGVQPQ